MSQQLLNWINGEAKPAASQQWMENINPANGKVLSEIPRSQADDVDLAVAAAQACYEIGGGGQGGAGGLTEPQRTELLVAVAGAVEARLEEFALAESLDTGKPLGAATKMDIPRAVDNLRFFAHLLAGQKTDAVAMADGINYVLRRPLGVVALITPWNFPLHLLTWKLGPAIAMGNSVVAKPSEMTPSTATLLAEVFTQVGAPPGLFNVIHGLGGEAGDALVRHSQVKAVSFTGGTQTGKTIAATAAPALKKLGLELGGKNPSLVFEDCDFEATVAGTARAAFFNSGQVCLCGSRILVESQLHDKFTSALVEQAQAMKTKLGPLISQSHRSKVKQYVDQALQDGAKLECGGEIFGPDEGAFFAPTVLTGLSHDCASAQEEIFGPVVSIHPFDDEQHALSLANDTAYGLSATIWTQDLGRAHRLAESIESGMVWINTWSKRDLRVPFGGMKQSGVGREGGRYSMEFFSQDRNICLQL
jgi:aminomuconate-semialdehyde/2-hydroxymuconate-6-semialdehyde dehydrogenase